MEGYGLHVVNGIYFKEWRLGYFANGMLLRGFVFRYQGFYSLLNEGMFKNGILKQGTTFFISHDGKKKFWDVTDNGSERTSFLS